RRRRRRPRGRSQRRARLVARRDDGDGGRGRRRGLAAAAVAAGAGSQDADAARARSRGEDRMTPGALPPAAVSWAAWLRTWLLEPVADAPGGDIGRAVEVEPTPQPRVRVAVVGLGPACGATTVARGLAAALATRDPGGAAIVSSAAQAAGATLPPLRGASRLAARLPGAMAVGRLCVWHGSDPAGTVVSAGPLAPIVFDVPHDGPASDSASLADATVLVAPGDAEP